jgi:hypothetical protein
MREKHSTSNIQQRTSNLPAATEGNPLDVGCWMLDVECCPKEAGR